MLLISCANPLKGKSSFWANGYVFGSQGYALFVDGRMDDALAAYRKAWTEARKFDIPSQAAQYRCNIGRCYYEKEVYDSAVVCCVSAYADFIRCGDSASARSAAGIASLAYSGAGNADSAFFWYAMGKAGYSQKKEKAFWLSVHGRVLWNRDHSALALKDFNDAQCAYKKCKDYYGMTLMSYSKAYANFVLSDYACAKVCIDSALILGDKASLRHDRWKMVLLASAIALAQNDAATAAWYYDRAVACAPRGSIVPALSALHDYRRSL
jgi:tetratricopeptide (TPR) repeat protein